MEQIHTSKGYKPVTFLPLQCQGIEIVLVSPAFI